MKEFEIYIDEQISLWRQLKAVVKASSPEEAKRLALDPANIECSEATEYYWETTESLGLEFTEDKKHQYIKEI